MASSSLCCQGAAGNAGVLAGNEGCCDGHSSWSGVLEMVPDISALPCVALRRSTVFSQSFIHPYERP